MATIYASVGDTVIIGRENYRVDENGGEPILVAEMKCAACGRNQGDDFSTPFGNLCARCVNTATEHYIAQLALNHLMANDEEIVEVIHIMERSDNEAKAKGISHVDFHSSAIDYARGMTDDNWMAFTMSLGATIRRIYESGVYIERT